MEERKNIAVLLGDATGIGPELVAKSCVNGYLQKHCNSIVIGDKRVFDMSLELVGGKDFPYREVSDPEKPDFTDGLCFYDQKDCDPAQVPYGAVNAVAGLSTIHQLDLGIDLWRKGVVGSVLFAPFNKAAIKAALGPSFLSQHTYAKEKLGDTGYSCEINHVRNIYTTRVMSHVPMVDIPKYMTVDNVKNSIVLLWNTLTQAGYQAPRIAVAALNPHCGEYGTCGDEEIRVIAPGIEAAAKQGCVAVGPISADTLFTRAINNGEFDGVVTMYHDQGQIALKLFGFENGVSIEGGLSCPLVTPSHGTAFEIAGKGVAKTSAFELAVLDAIALAR